MSVSTAWTALHYLRNKAVAASTSAGSRVYTSHAQQTAIKPYVVMDIISRVESPTQDSGSAVDTFRIQVDCYAEGVKSGTTMSAFKQADTLAQALREAWSRTSDGLNYDNNIDSVQEAGYLTDRFPDLAVQRVSNDYFVRVKSGTGPVISNVDTSEDEQVWPYQLVDGQLLYWRTYTFASGNDDFETLTGLLQADVDFIYWSRMQSANTEDTSEFSQGALIEKEGLGYKVFLSAQQEAIKVTIWYVKN